MESDAAVLIVGAGPAGATLANLLATYGISALLIDKELDVLDYPRAVGIDDEALRTIDTFELADLAMTDMVCNTPVRYYSSAGHCFAHVKPSARPFGFPRRNNFLQPMLERRLRTALEGHEGIEIVLGCELVSFTQDADGVTAELLLSSGDRRTVRTTFLIGADGGKSTVRSLAGIALDGTTHATKWLVVDVRNDTWDAPYAAVYCDPVSPSMVIALPFQHRRFEFRLDDVIDEGAATADEAVMARLQRFYRDLPLPELVRARVYQHHSRVATRFSTGRVYLVGDAAHLQPPFFGQGMNSGFRDVFNLGWKLAATLDGAVGPSVLASYDTERRSHAAAMVSFATRIGKLYSPRSRGTERVRDAFFKAVTHLPGARDYILQMKYKPMPNYEGGLVLAPGSKGTPIGRMLAQPTVERLDGSRLRLDKALGAGFSILGIHRDPGPSLSAASRAQLDRLGARLLEVRVPRDVALEHRDAPAAASKGVDVIADTDGAFEEMLLARPDEEVLIIRPDRYVAAACRATELDATVAALARLLEIPVAGGGSSDR